VIDVAEFLRVHPPFDALDEWELAKVAAAAEPEEHRAGATILARGDGPPAHVRVVRTGGVEIVHDGRVLDLLGHGEMFGHAAMLAGLPLGFTAVARGATTCLRLPADAVRPVLGGPAGLRYVARSLLAPTLLAPSGPVTDHGPDPAQRPVRELLRADRMPLCTAPPDLSIRDAARRMTACGASSVVVPLEHGRVGILTDRDLRTVIADGTDTAAPVSTVMTAPAWTAAADRLGGEVLLDMLDRGVRHVPVLDATGGLVGVLTDADVVAATTRSSFGLRAAIARATSVQELVTAAAQLGPTVIALHDARVAATDIAGIHSVVVDALTRRLIELVAPGPPPRPLAWLALGCGPPPLRARSTPARPPPWRRPSTWSCSCAWPTRWNSCAPGRSQTTWCACATSPR
jgi:CBS domain-containing protein